MKVKFSWWVSDSEHHTSEWDVPYMDAWPICRAIEEYIELRRLRQMAYEVKKALQGGAP